MSGILETFARPEEPLALREALRRANVSLLLGTILGSMVTVTLIRYGQCLGLSTFLFGVLASVQSFAALAQLPTSFVVERYGRRKAIALCSSLGHSVLWLLIAAIPWILPAERSWLGLLGLVASASIFGNVSGLAGTAWLADLVPSRVLSRYLAFRSQITRFVNLALVLFVGWWMDRALSVGPERLRLTISAILIPAALFAIASVFLASSIPDAWHRPRLHKARFWQTIFRPLVDRNFCRYLCFSATMSFATGYVGAFSWLYLFDVVGASNTETIIILVIAPAIIGILVLPVWARILDRWGNRNVLLVAGLVVVYGSCSYLFITPETKWTGSLTLAIAFVGWPAIDLAGSNLVFQLSQTRREGGLGSSCVALSSAATAMAGTLSGLFAGAVAHSIEGWRGQLWGWPLTFHHVLFFISAGLRLLALAWLIGMKDRPVAPTVSRPLVSAQ